MPNLEDEIRAVLRPLMGDRNSRLGRLNRAFAAYPGLLDQINVDETTAVFLDLLARLRLQPTDACANSLWTNGSGVSKTGY